MKEVTRVHIAKQAYDIELAAKKQLETYIKTLEKYAQDQDLLYDIEIRITELLLEHGVAAGGVITVGDIEKVRSKLGEPSDFATDGSSQDPEPLVGEKSEIRRVYRDVDSAILGGVLAGFGRFFNIDPLWIRLIFLVLLVGSYGTAAVVYAILWLIMPPARTAAEKLQMRGQAVTLDAIKQLGLSDSQPETAAVARLWIGRLAGVGLILAGIGALLAVAVVTGFSIFGQDQLPISGFNIWASWPLMITFGLMALAGVLLATLFFVLADAVLRRRWSRRVGIIVIAIIASGLISSVTAALVGRSVMEYEMRRVQEAVVQETVELPAEFANVKKLTAIAHSLRSQSGASSELIIEYVVDDLDQVPRYELTALPGMKPHVLIDGDEARISFKSNTLHDQFQGWLQPRLIIRGPALEEIDVQQGYLHYSSAYPDGQAGLVVRTGATTQATLTGQFGQLTADGDGAVDLAGARIDDLSIKMEGGSVQAGAVRNLEVWQPESCLASRPHDHEFARVQVQAVSSGKLRFNDILQDAKTIRHGCGVVVIGDDIYNEN